MDKKNLNYESRTSNNKNIGINNKKNIKKGMEKDINNRRISDSPKIPKSVIKAIKDNEGRKISVNDYNSNSRAYVNSHKNVKNNSNIKNQKNIKKKKATLFITFVISILICAFILLFKLPYFNLVDININGTDRYTKEEILEKSNITLGSNIFTQALKYDKKNITTLPYISDVNIDINFPNKITFKIKERTSKYIAYDSDNDAFYRLSEDGYILEKTDINSKTSDELLLMGIPFYDFTTVGTKIDDIYVNKIETYKLIEAEYKNNNFNGNITKVNFANSLTTITINDKLNVVFPNDTELQYKMKILKKILNELGEDTVGKIDMTKTNPTFSIF